MKDWDKRYVTTISGVVVILTAWKMCGEACKHSCCNNMSGIAHVHLISCSGCVEGSAEVFLAYIVRFYLQHPLRVSSDGCPASRSFFVRLECNGDVFGH